LSGKYYGQDALPGAERVTRYQAVWDANQPLDTAPEPSREQHLLDLCKLIARLVGAARPPNNLPFTPLGDLLKGREVPGDPTPDDDKFNHWPHINIEYANNKRLLGDGIRTIRLGHTEFLLSSKEELEEVSAILRSLIICQHISGVSKDHSLLHSLILLLILSTGDRAVIRKALDSVQNNLCVAYMAQEAHEILTVAKSTAASFLEDRPSENTLDTSATSSFSASSLAAKSNPESEKLQVIYFWMYAICANVSLSRVGLDIFRPMRLPIYNSKSLIYLFSLF